MPRSLISCDRAATFLSAGVGNILKRAPLGSTATTRKVVVREHIYNTPMMRPPAHAPHATRHTPHATEKKIGCWMTNTVSIIDDRYCRRLC